MTTFEVKAQAFDRNNGRVRGASRVEVIDPRANRLFTGANTIMKMKEAYEAFWNNMNPNSTEVVFVQQITMKR